MDERAGERREPLMPFDPDIADLFRQTNQRISDLATETAVHLSGVDRRMTRVENEMRGGFMGVGARFDRLEGKLDAFVAAQAIVNQNVQASLSDIRSELQATGNALTFDLLATRDELKAELQATRDELKAELQATRDESKADVQTTRDGLKADLLATRDELKADLLATRDELKADVQATRDELKEDFRSSLDEVKADVHELKISGARTERKVDDLASVVRVIDANLRLILDTRGM